MLGNKASALHHYLLFINPRTCTYRQQQLTIDSYAASSQSHCTTHTVQYFTSATHHCTQLTLYKAVAVYSTVPGVYNTAILTPYNSIIIGHL